MKYEMVSNESWECILIVTVLHIIQCTKLQ